VIRIDVLPDDVLLEIFDFYMIMPVNPSFGDIETWQSLVHVCQRWRNLVFGSPRRLNLQLCCRPNTPARDTLDVWPALPLIVAGYMTSSDTRMDNEQSRMRSLPLGSCGLAIGEILGCDAGPIPGIDRAGVLLKW
jgi:hypothetical protein